MAGGSAPLAQSDLEALGLFDGVGVEQIVDGLVGGDQGQAVGDLKTLLTEGAALAHPADAQSGLRHPRERQGRFHRWAWTPRPATEQIPGAQAQMFGKQQPQAQWIARNFIGQPLARLPLQAFGISRFGPLFAAGALGLEATEWNFGIKLAEFFFCRP